MASRRIEDLHPRLQPLHDLWLRTCHYAGLDPLPTSTRRTFGEQADLYDQGRISPGRIVTKARAGWSWHNYGLAWDFVPLRHGKPVWSASDSLWRRCGISGEAIGLSWGGRWKRFRDLPHLEWHPRLDIRTALQIKIDESIPEDYFDGWIEKWEVGKMDIGDIARLSPIK